LSKNSACGVSEAKHLDFRNPSDTAVLPTISVTSPTANSTTDAQTTDGFTPGNPAVMRVFQISTTVGRDIQRSATM